MRITAVVLYLVCLFVFILFSRQPDWFDGERTPAVIVQHNGAIKAEYTIGKEVFYADADYAFRNYKAGDQVEVIYEASQTRYATVYSWWGYWIRWQEILVSLLFFIGLYKVATSITNAPEEVKSQNSK